jgi:hypothetical protein
MAGANAGRRWGWGPSAAAVSPRRSPKTKTQNGTPRAHQSAGSPALQTAHQATSGLGESLGAYSSPYQPLGSPCRPFLAVSKKDAHLRRIPSWPVSELGIQGRGAVISTPGPCPSAVRGLFGRVQGKARQGCLVPVNAPPRRSVESRTGVDPIVEQNRSLVVACWCCATKALHRLNLYTTGIH